MRRSRSFQIQRRSSLKKTPPVGSPRRTPSPTTRSIPQQIQDYIDARGEVQILVHFEKYREQFFTKAGRLHECLLKMPQIRNTYISEDNIHFQKALTFLMVDLYKKGVIPPLSFDNLRLQAIKKMEDWVLGWIQRKLQLQKAIEEERAQVMRTCEALAQLEEYARVTEVEELPF